MVDINLRWDRRCTPDGHRLYRSTSPISPLSLPTVLATVSGDVGSYVDKTGSTGTDYYYLLESFTNSPARSVFTENLFIPAVGESVPVEPDPELGVFAMFHVTANGTDVISADTYTPLPLGVVVEDDASLYSLDAFRLPESDENIWFGYFSAGVEIDDNTDLFIDLQISDDNGSNWLTVAVDSASTASKFATVSAMIEIPVGRIVRSRAGQVGGSDRTIQNNANTFFSGSISKVVA